MGIIRRHILDAIKNDPDGNKYLQFIMKYLSLIERKGKGRTRENIEEEVRLPQTIQEAYVYFRLEDPTTGV